MIVTIPDLLDSETVGAVRAALAGAPWEDGKSTAHGKSKSGKNNLVVPLDHKASQAAGKLILEQLAQHEGFRAAAVPKIILPLKFCRYDQGMAYADHLDLPLMGGGSGGGIRTDISMSVFLSDPSQYGGGELVFESDYGTHRVRGAAGEAVLYPASTLHRVEAVTHGSRLVAITWIQSLIRDPAQRRLLFDVAQVATQLDADPRHGEAARTLRKSQYNLLRMWAE